MNELLTSLRAHRLPGLTLFDGAIHPNYGGQSILNVPSSVCQLLGVPPLAAPPLRPEILEPLGGSFRSVVVILMDALAFHRLERWLAADDSLIWHRLLERGVLAPLTSITPSTTSAALTTLWTGSPPAGHGVMGYEMWLKEYGIVADMIQHRPVSYHWGAPGLHHAGFQPGSFLPTPSISTHLRAHGVTPHVFQHVSIVNSGLSQTFFGDAERHGITTPADTWVSVRELLDGAPHARHYVWAYWGAIDTFSHLKGPDDERVEAEFAAFSAAFERNFLGRLSPAARGNTAVILIADHGQRTTDRGNRRYNLANHPDFLSRLHIKPTGENRFTYLYIRPGQEQAVRDYIEAAWPGEFHLLDPAEALSGGLFGPGPRHPRVAERTGDLIAAARENAYWWWSAEPDPLIGRHGGLTADEMIVPFLAARL